MLPGEERDGNSLCDTEVDQRQLFKYLLKEEILLDTICQFLVIGKLLEWRFSPNARQNL